MENKEYYVGIVKRFISEYFPNSAGVMITGSFVSDYFNEYSDLDVVILSRWHYKVFVESYEYEGIKVQVIALPLFDAHSILVRDSMSRNGAIISMLSKGLIIYDSKDFLQKLKIDAEKLIGQKRAISKEQLDMERSKLTTLYEDICGVSDREDLVFAIVDAMPKALNMYLLINGSWQYHGKSAARILRSSNDAFLQKYIGALDAFFKIGDKTLVIQLLQELLDAMGGELHYHTTKSYKDVVDSDDMVICISPRSNDKELDVLNRIDYAFHLFIERRCKKLRYVSFVNKEDGLFSRGLYIIINSSKQQLNGEILPLIHQFQFGNPASVSSGLTEHWIYPYTINPLFVRGVYSMPIFDFFYSISSRKYKCADRIQYAIDILSGISKCDIVRNTTSIDTIWGKVFEMFLSSHLNKMLPADCINIVNYYCPLKLQI